MGLRVATWNLDRPRTNQESKVAALRVRMREVDADIWLLTESHEAMEPTSEHLGAHTEHIDNYKRHTDGERRASIWSRFPIQSLVVTHDPETAVCVEVESPVGPALVYATVIPYHAAGTSLIYRSGGEFVQGLSAYDLHLSSIDRHRADWTSLRNRYPAHHFILGGDFNQHRDGVGSYGKKGFEPLSQALKEAELICVTESDFNSLGELVTRRNVDHICLDPRLASSVAATHAWEAGKYDGSKQLSDHNGVLVGFLDPLN